MTRRSMVEEYNTEQRDVKVGLLGACFDTGNMGVSALAESSIKLILNRWPDAQVTLVGSTYEPQEHHLVVMGKELTVKTLPIRFSKNLRLPTHFFWYAFYGFLAKAMPRAWFKKKLARRNPYFETLYEMDIVLDITGGDSFSDIYGMKRFFLGFLQKWLILFLKKPFILLPQTYGPFKRKRARALARHILKRAGAVYSRDRQGLDYTKNLLNVHSENGKLRFAPDVAFVLDPAEPRSMDIGSLNDVRTKDSIVVGLNISGLLFSGGYTRNNMFGLQTDYQGMIESVLDYVMADERTLVLLVPHVFRPDWPEEDDPRACQQMYEMLKEKYPGRIFLTQGTYNQNEIKYVIGLCDFFMGSRMHSCIAALSQSIPAVGIAYSKKFRGVFDTVGLGRCVAEVYQCDKDELLSIVKAAFEERDQIRSQLNSVLPDVKSNIMNMFETVDV